LSRFFPAIPPALASRFRLAWVWTGALGLLHGVLIWVGMGGWSGLTSPWPIARHDHPLHFHGARNAHRYFGISGTNAGYDPSFMAGYAASAIPNTSTTFAGVLVSLFGRNHPVLAYKLYVLLSAAAVPWLVVAAGLVWRLQPSAIGIAVLLYLIYVWTDFPLRYVEFGMVGFFLAVPLALLTTAILTDYLERGGLGRWLGAAVCSSVVFLVHVTVPMVIVPAVGLAYVAAVAVARRGGTRFPPVRHLGLWSLPAIILAANAFWWLPVYWLASTKGGWDPSFTHPEPVLGRLFQIFNAEAPIQSVLWAGAFVGLIALAHRQFVAAVALGTFLASGLFWGYLAGASRALDPLQPGRQTYALYAASALAAGIGIAEIAGRVRGSGPGRLDRWLALGALLCGLRVFGPSLAASYQERISGPEPFLSSRPSLRLRWLVGQIKTHVRPGERLLYEEGGSSRPGFPDIFHGDRYSGLLPFLTRVEMLGGPFLRVLVKENFTQFGEGRLFEKDNWGREHFERYAKLYRPGAILCWSAHSRAFCKANPDLIRVLADDGVLLLGRVEGFEGDTIVGTAEVEAEPGRLHVSGAVGGVDGTVVLRYHSVPCLRSRPRVAWDSVYLESDPVPFIRLRAPLGRVTLELGIPPESGN
jgi:hypothetical protein